MKTWAFKRGKTHPSNRTSYPKIIKINRGRKLLGKRKTNPSREYRKSVGERNGTTSRKFYILHSISHPAEPLKRGVKILPGRSGQPKWRQRWSPQSTAGRRYEYGVPPNSRGRQRGAYYDSLGKNNNKKSSTPTVYIKISHVRQVSSVGADRKVLSGDTTQPSPQRRTILHTPSPATPKHKTYD